MVLNPRDQSGIASLGPDTRGYIGNYQDMNFNDMYSYTPQGITIEDFSKPSKIGDFAVTAAPDLRNQSGYINPAPQIFEPKQPNMLNRLTDFGKMVGGGILSTVAGVPFLGSALQGFSSQFENRPLGAAVIDEFGNVYSEDELNMMNAAGGYYTEPARSARRRQARIRNMIERQNLGKRISEKNLAELQAQERAQEAARQAAADAMQAENRDRGRGGYQSSFAQDSDFMEGPSGPADADQEASSPGSTGPGGSDTMGSFMDGGIVDLVDIYD